MTIKKDEKTIVSKDVVICNLRIPLDTTSNQTITIEDLGDYIFRFGTEMYYGTYELIKLIKSLPYNTDIKVITRDGYGSSDIEARTQQRKRERVVEDLIWFIDSSLFPDEGLSWTCEMRELYHQLAKNTFNIRTAYHIGIINAIRDRDYGSFLRYKEYLDHLLVSMKKDDFIYE